MPRYSLTLHNQHNKRILGYDNAHLVRSPNKYKYAGRILTYDHKHLSAIDKGIPYEFINAYQLLEDFFADVDSVLNEAQKK